MKNLVRPAFFHLLVCALMGAQTNYAWAWGDREQGILTGVAGYWLFNRLYNLPQQPPYDPRMINGVSPSPYLNGSMYQSPGLIPQTYNCLVPVRDPLTGQVRNQVYLCVQ